MAAEEDPFAGLTRAEREQKIFADIDGLGAKPLPDEFSHLKRKKRSKQKAVADAQRANSGERPRLFSPVQLQGTPPDIGVPSRDQLAQDGARILRARVPRAVIAQSYTIFFTRWLPELGFHDTLIDGWVHPITFDKLAHGVVTNARNPKAIGNAFQAMITSALMRGDLPHRDAEIPGDYWTLERRRNPFERGSASDGTLRLIPPGQMSLDLKLCLSYEDLIHVTPTQKRYILSGKRYAFLIAKRVGVRKYQFYWYIRGEQKESFAELKGMFAPADVDVSRD